MSLNNTIIPIIQEDTPYGYVPSRNIVITFIVLFSISTALHLGQLVRHRMWWLLTTVCLCGAMEIAGWSARLWSTFSPLLSAPFQMQVTLTIIGPTPLLAANFIILGEVIKYLGPSYSRLSPRMYSIIFCTCDVISLFVQGAGGGIAAAAQTVQGGELGSNVMLTGIAFQLFVIVSYAICGIEFFVRYTHGVPFRATSGWKIWEKKSVHLLRSGRRAPLTTNLKFMIGGLVFNTTVLFIRTIYRTIELVDGWNGRIITNELYFNVLDGTMIILAIYTLNFIHPGMFLEKVTDASVPEKEFNRLESDRA